MPDRINPQHYKSHPSGVECIAVTRLMNFTLGNAVKYIWRYEDANGYEDLRKARWYLKDHLANGCAHSPSYKAKRALDYVCTNDPVPLRRILLHHIALGQLNEAIGKIDEVVKRYDELPA